MNDGRMGAMEQWNDGSGSRVAGREREGANERNQTSLKITTTGSEREGFSGADGSRKLNIASEEEQVRQSGSNRAAFLTFFVRGFQGQLVRRTLGVVWSLHLSPFA